MTLIDGHVQFAGWVIHLQAAAAADPYGYDGAQAKYDTAGVVYNADSRARSWVTLDCQLLRVTAGLGGSMEPIPGMRANLGRLTADLYDPGRVLDPAASPYALLVSPGIGVRLVAVQPGSGTVWPLWTGIADVFEHDLLTGEGRLEASDLVALLTGVDVAGWQRPPETGLQRLRAVLAVMPNPVELSYAGTAPALSAAQYSGDLWSAVVRTTAEAEQSIVWLDRVGVLRRVDTAGLGAAIAASDCDDGTSPIIYTRLTSLVDSDRLVNLVAVDRLSAADANREPLKFSRPTSVSRHGPRSLTETRLALPDDAALRLWAADLLALRAYPVAGITGMSVTVTDLFPWVARTVPAVAGLDVGDVLDVDLTSRGQAESWTVAVAGVEHTITPDSWEVRLELADGPAAVPGMRRAEARELVGVST